jgi:hypothetical protein
MKKLLLILAASIFMLSSCTKSGSEGPGKLVVKVTDDPFNIDYVESATVTITKIEIKKAGDGVSDGNPFLIISEDTVTFDLLTLRNGITEEIANIDIPQGNYDQVRLYVDQASLRIKGQSNAYTVKVPSGKQTGIKIFIRPSLSVSGGLTSELLLDFDLSKSFVMRGNMAHSAGVNGFIFKPCIKAANNSTAGRIEGHVADTANKIMIENAKVWVMQDTIMATAFTDATGYYAFIGVPAGTYTVFANKEDVVNAVDYDTVNYSGVTVVPANRTIQDFILNKK